MKQISGAFLLHIATAFTTQERSRSPVFHYILLQHPHTYLHPLVQHFRGSLRVPRLMRFWDSPNCTHSF